MPPSQLPPGLPDHELTMQPQCTTRNRQCTPSAPAMQHPTDRTVRAR